MLLVIAGLLGIVRALLHGQLVAFIADAFYGRLRASHVLVAVALVLAAKLVYDLDNRERGAQGVAGLA
jgi:hypothetical protein